MSKGYNQLKNLNLKELDERIPELKKELMKLQAQVATRTLPEKPGRIRQIKRTIARILTVQKTKEASQKG
jgi:large subunit ribosomal protein L29